MDKTQELCQCPECGLHYEGEQIAKQCEAWCKEHGGCNFEITKFSVERTKTTKTYNHVD